MIPDMYNKEIDIIVLTKYLAGEATPEEAMAIAHWIEIPANKKQYDEIRSVWSILNETNNYKNPGITDAWAQLQNSVSEKRPFRKIKIMRRLYIAAAFVTGIIACGLVFYIVFNNHPTTVEQKFIKLSASKDLLKSTLAD